MYSALPSLSLLARFIISGQKCVKLGGFIICMNCAILNYVKAGKISVFNKTWYDTLERQREEKSFHSVNGREACCLSLSTVWMGGKRVVYPFPQCEWERSVLFIPLHSVNRREACCLSLVYQAQTLSWGKGKEKRRQLGLRGCQFEPLTLRLGLWAQLGRLYLRCYRNGNLSLSQDSSNLCAPEGNWECSHFPMMTEHIWRSQQPGSSSQLTSLLRPDD